MPSQHRTSAQNPLNPGESVSKFRHTTWRDHENRLIRMRNPRSLSKRDLIAIVERLQDAMWIGSHAGDRGLFETPDIEDGGCGGSDFADIAHGIFARFYLNPVQ